ncbi:hypothetical protein [Streptomyces parvus]|uniref:hypothetical protein n=1 Tax=Streptomyces parvus TaxID=66428 RepID=UPI002101A84C|nr:hypothetical protein [Streptomyces parvus]MCQ1577231.1 hypothetical protein [Streptomyces parvus]
MINSVVSGERRRITVDLPSNQPIIDMFDQQRAIAQVTLSFTDTVLKAVRLTADDGEDAYVSHTDLEDPGSWPDWLRDLITEHRPSPFGTGQQLADALLAALREETKERAVHSDASDGPLLARLDELEPAEALCALDELDLLTGSLLRAAKDALTYLDRRTYGSATYQQN